MNEGKSMKLSRAIKPISYFKAHATEIIRDLSEKDDTLIITQNGVAKAVLQDIHRYEETQESLAVLKLLAMSRDSLNQGKFRPADDVLNDIEKSIQEDNGE